MNRSTKLSALSLLLVAVFLGGCSMRGLSNREYGNHTITNYLYSLPADSPSDAPVRTPMRLGVVQLGEIAPQQEVMQKLAKQKSLISHIEPLPAWIAQTQRYVSPYDQRMPANVSEEKSVKDVIEHVLTMAEERDLDYVLFVGGTVEQQTLETDRTVWDMTILGAWLIPSHELEANAKAIGVLMDVNNSRVAMMSYAASDGRRDEPTATVHAGQQRLLNDMRQQVGSNLADRFLQDLRKQGVASLH